MIQSLRAPRSWIAALCGAAALLFSASAFSDPPARVARLTQIEGTVSFSPAGEEDWALAEANRPLISGDRVWSDAGSHVELQIGAGAARLGANTSVTILNLDDTIAQFQLAQGTLNIRVRQIYGDQFYEVDTPNLAFSIRRAGDYRIDVDPDGNATIVSVRSGSGEAWGEGAAYVIAAGQQYTFVGEGLRDYRFASLPPPDEFDRWTFGRNRQEDAAVAARYVSPEVIGYDDLDEYGTWRNVQGYGSVWVPTAVAPGWAPYRFGRWAWVEPWGWTWIDDAPWGFAPFHYGRWAFASSRWFWVPGPIAVRPVYAPALVAFVGGGGFSLAISTGPVEGVAWFPLAPGEVYRPAYTVSRTYFTNINVSNTVVNRTVINNVYNNVNVTNIVYRNREAPGAVTAVPTTVFAGGQSVSRNAVRVSSEVIARERVTPVAAVAPSRAAVLAVGGTAAGGAAVAAVRRPPAAVLRREVVAKTAPPAPPASFAARSSLLASQPGKPLEAEKATRLRTERAAEAPKVKMVAPGVRPQPLAKGAPQAGPGPQQERPKERRAAPQGAPVPQPPVSAQERFKGQPQGGQVQQQERPRERRAAPQGAPVPQPPASAQERFKGQPQGQVQPQERPKERRAAPQGAPLPQPPASAQERFKGQPQGGQVQQQERPRERRAAPQGAPAGPPPQQQQQFRQPQQQIQRQPQQQIQKGPPPGPQSQGGPPEPRREEGKGKEGKGKEKDKERPPGQ
ncbi:MAG TPA: DUF6600 domain-containing protein [Casimicrobiaceae bacterium]